VFHTRQDPQASNNLKHNVPANPLHNSLPHDRPARVHIALPCLLQTFTPHPLTAAHSVCPVINLTTGLTALAVSLID